MENQQTFTPKNQQDWRKWLEKNHQTEDSIWLVFFKKSSKTPNLDWGQAVDEALCFGWIDSTKKSIDSERFKQYFCKRKPKSNWSKVNKDKVEVLKAAGLMREQGLKCIEVAKENGSWTILDSVEKLEVPDDLELAFSLEPQAKSYYLGLSNSAKKGLLYWVISAKRAETRSKRIAEIVDCAKRKTLPKQFA